jgi:hypothetical protein
MEFLIRGIEKYGEGGVAMTFEETGEESAVTVSADSTVLYCSRAFAEIVAEPLDRIIGRSIYEFVPRSERERFDSVYKHPLDGPAKVEVSFCVGQYFSGRFADHRHGDYRSDRTKEARRNRLRRTIGTPDRTAGCGKRLPLCDNSGRVILASQAHQIVWEKHFPAFVQYSNAVGLYRKRWRQTGVFLSHVSIGWQEISRRGSSFRQRRRRADPSFIECGASETA